MGIRLSGLNSGMDTDSIVKALMSAQSMKKTKIESKKTKLEWKKEIWGDLNTKLYDFYRNTLAKIKSQSTYKTKAATSSDTSKITATAGTSASEGTYKVKVVSTASAQNVTSGKLKGAETTDENGVTTRGKATSSSKLVDLLDASGNKGFQAGTQISIQSASGLSTLVVDENTTVRDFVAAAQNAGLTASFDEGQQRFFISSNTSGADQKFTITAGTLSQGQLDAIADWKKAVGYDYLNATDKKAVSKIFDQLQSGAATYDDVSEKLNNYVNSASEAGVKAYYEKQLTEGYQAQYFTNSNHDTVSAAGKQALLDAGYTEETYNTWVEEDRVAAIGKLISGKVKEDMASDTYKQKVEDGVTNGISGASDSFLSSSAAQRTTAVETEARNYNSTMSGITAANGQLSYLGLGEVTGDKVDEVSGDGMVVRKAGDATITLNGATLTSSSSSITVNGLTLNLLDTTDGDEITVSVTKDNSAVYDTIKDFISEYNAILKEMNTKYNAESARGYDVLTSDQKEAMSEEDIENWNDKIKSSLLRRDNTLSSLISSFRNNMMSTYTASNGKRYSLASLGIMTSNDYKEGGLLHIKGDEDDTVYGDAKNTLESMINEDPNLVMEIMTGITDNLYSDLQKKMSTTTLSSALTFYNDKEMASQLSDYKKSISEWEVKLAELENRYYSQFTAMEKAMAKLNSQQNYFASMLG